jgi:hypothetical protein
MKFFASLILLSLCFANSFAQVTVTVNWTQLTKMPSSDVIYYNLQQNLTWADFKGNPAPPSPVAAITSSGFGYKADMKSYDGKGQINILVYCFFNKQKSWVRIKQKNAYVLEHEQHHFDATYLAAVSFINNVRAAKITIENMDAILSNYYKAANEAMNTLQHNYDTETSNGLLKTQQLKWNNYFNQQISALKVIK